ncbi:MAG: hypothetical protein WBR30_19400, partial [Candidatus Sulfotelmatobacter sp.]
IGTRCCTTSRVAITAPLSHTSEYGEDAESYVLVVNREEREPPKDDLISISLTSISALRVIDRMPGQPVLVAHAANVLQSTTSRACR